MFKKRLIYLFCAFALAVSMIGVQTASAAYAGPGNQMIKNAAKAIGGKAQASLASHLFNPLLSVKVKKGQVTFDVGLVNKIGRITSVNSVSYQVRITDEKGNAVKTLEEKTLNSVGSLKQGRSKALNAAQTWDLRTHSGQVAAPGKYTAQVTWRIRMGSSNYEVSERKTFMVNRKDIAGVQPSKSPVQGQEKAFVTVDTAVTDRGMVIDFALLNQTANDLTIPFGGQIYDLVIKNEKTQEVYRWSKDKMFTMALSEKVIKAGSQLRFQEIWDFKGNDGKLVAPGKYTLRAEFVPYNYTPPKGVEIKLFAEKQITVTGAETKLATTVSLDTKVVDGNLKINFELKNNTRENIRFHFASGQMYDVIITNKNGNEVYRWSDDMVFTEALVEKVLETSKPWRDEITWNFTDNNGARVAPGEYWVRVEYVPYQYSVPSGMHVNLIAEKGVEVTALEVNRYVAVNLQPRRVNQELIIPFSLRNISKNPLTLRFHSGQRFDIVIRDREGKEIYRWSNGQFFIQSISYLTLNAGESLPEESIRLNLNDYNITRGAYTVEVEFKAALEGVSAFNASELKAVQTMEIQ